MQARPGQLLPNRITVEGQPGLYLHVTPNNAKSWRFDYRFGGKRRVIVYGLYPLASLAEAKEKHRGRK